MKRILVLGCCGAGKSTFARKMQMITGLELIPLDRFYWQPNWTEPDPSFWKEEVQRLTQKSTWIMDGNYAGTLDIRLREADTIFYFDFPTWLCLWRVTKRTLKYWGHVRPEMAPGCRERFDWPFFHYILLFNLSRRKRLLKMLSEVEGGKKLYIFTNDRQSNDFLKDWRKTP